MAEAQQEDFSKLPLDDKLGHKVWKARLMGYEEATKLFKKIDDENSPEYGKYTGLVRKFPVESNAVAQEKALEATLAFTEYAAAAGKICSEVVAGIVTKCLNARPKTKELGISICLMYVEIEKQDIVIEEIMKGFSNKQPKIVAASVSVIRRALEEFGAKVFNIKVLLKSVAGVFEHSDKNVRAEAKTLAIELFKWVGAALKASIDGKIKPVQMKELEDEFSKLPGTPPTPTRLLRSQQAAAQAAPTGGNTASGGGLEGGVAISQPEEIDPYDLLDPVNMLDKMPKDFFDRIVDTKWKERKEALEAILPLAQSPKLEPGEYGELIKVLKKIITKDSNVMVVALAGNVITGLAKGLRKKFTPYAATCTAGIFEKFKEKKANVVTSLREAIDAVYLTTSLGNIQDECIEALNNKNPSVKAESLLFLSRCYCQCAPTMIPKPYLKAMCPLILQRLDDTNPQVRDGSMEALGTLLKALGDRAMTSYLENVDKTKMTKINEFKDKVVMNVKVSAAPPQPVKQAPPKEETPSEKPKQSEAPKTKKVKAKSGPKKAEPKSSEAESKAKDPPPSKKAPPKSGATKSTTSAAPTGGGGASKGKSKGGAMGGVGEPPEVSESNVSNEELDDKAKEVLPDGLFEKLAETAWKERLAGHEQLKEFIGGLPPGEMNSILYIKILGKKPGWKDSNFQVMNCKFSIISLLAEKSPSFGKKSFSCALPALVDKFADIKVKVQSGDTLLTIAEKMTLNYTSLQVLKYAFDQKSPKVHSESLEMLCRGLKEFGFLLNVKPHVDYIKKALGATNPAVRTAAINLLATLHMYLGPQLRMFFEEEKPALLQQIDSAFAKSAGETAPPPIRGPNVKDESEAREEGGGGGEGGAGGDAPTMSLADLMPKVDISGQIKADLIKELGDKNWKIRGEALQKIQDIIAQAKFIQPSLGDLPGGLKGRLADSNKNLMITTMNIIGSLAGAMGSACSKFNKIFIPGVLGTLVDAKVQVRTAAIACLNAWVNEVPISVLFEQDLIAGSLATENPNLRTELLGWLEDKLPSCSKLPSETQSIIHPVFIALEDRSAEVRKKAQAVVPVLMTHVGYEAMVKVSGKLQPASKQQVKALLDKHRPAVMAKAPASSSSGAESSGDQKPSSKKDVTSPPSKGPATKKTAASAGKGKSTKAGKGSDSKKGADDSIEGAPLLLLPNGKEQRMKDDEKLKILKWNFQMPRPEHIDQLKDQLVICVNLAVHKKMFHDDFKQQLSAISILTEFVSNPDNIPTSISCCDLLLRWVTLKFFETNTTVNIKCLEFLHVLFKQLIGRDYSMTDYECAAFLPYLVIKVGDPKDPVRKEVRSLFRELWCIYQPAKIFPFVIDGLKSKNARQRTECLEILGELIQNNGMLVCQPSPQKSVPLIAKQISDRDNTVRSAALNAMVFVHAYVGESVYKFTSQLSDKDVSLLEERIKRSKKVELGGNRPKAPSPVTMPTGSSSRGPSPPVSRTPDQPTPPEIKVPSEVKIPAQAHITPNTDTHGPGSTLTTQREQPIKTSPPSRLPTLSGPFRMDMSKYRAPETRLVAPRVPKLDLSCFEGSDTIPVLATSKRVQNPPKPIRIPTVRSSTSSAVVFLVSQVDVSDFNTCFDALTRLEALVCDPVHHKTVSQHIDKIISTILIQMRINFTTNLSQSVSPNDNKRVIELGRLNTRVLVKIFEQPSLSVHATQPVLKSLVRDVFGYMIDDGLCVLEDIAQLIRVFNTLMAKIVDNAAKNIMISTLFDVLLETLDANGKMTGISEMTMKCLFRFLRHLNDSLPSLDIDQFLLDLEKFFEGYAKINSSPSSDDKPCRTAKSFIFHLVNILGLEVLEHLSLIPDPSSSYVTNYLDKMIEKKRKSGDLKPAKKPSASVTSSETVTEAKKTTPTTNESSTVSQPPLLRGEIPTEHAVLMNSLLERMKDRKTRKQAIIDLYDLKENRPDIDVTGCLSSGSAKLQDFVNRGFKLVKVMRETGKDVFSESIETDRLKESQEALRTIKDRAGPLMNIQWEELDEDRKKTNQKHAVKDTSSEDTKSQNDPGTRLGNISTDAMGISGTPKSDVQQHSGSGSGVKSSPSTADSSKLLEIRKRLDRLKAPPTGNISPTSEPPLPNTINND